jgi:galactokinase
LASSPRAAERIAEILKTAETRDESIGPEALLARFDHFRLENGEIRPAAGDALARGDIEAFGRFTEESQRLAEQLLGNQVPETVHLAASARECGAVASSAFGAGFGGSVWAMVPTSCVDSFLAAWAESYHTRFPQHAEASQFFATGAGPAAFQIS